MKYLRTVIFSLISIACIAQNPISPSDLEGIKANFMEQEKCWNKGDLECYVGAYSPIGEVQTISSIGVTKGVEAILANYKKYFPKDKMGKLHFDNFSYKGINAEYAYVVGRYNLMYEEDKEPSRGWFSVLMQKVEGKWYIISDHS